MKPRDTHKAIWKKFHVHHRDNLPFEGWWDSTRNTLIELFGELGFKEGAEIGVRMGSNASVMFEKIPGLKLHCIDPWEKYLRVTTETQDKLYQHCLRKLKGKNAVFMRMTSMEAVQQIPDESLDFVYLDGRHEYDYLLEDTIHWAPKVKRGGIVSGHDLYHFYQGGVVQAIEAYTMANNIQAWYITREKEHTWFLVKE